jgi:hypothetical protein
MAMAIRASVTVSMAEAMIGMLQDLGTARPEQHVIEGQSIDDLIRND